MSETGNAWPPRSTLFAAVVFAFFGAQVHAAFMAALALPFFFIYFLCRAVLSIWKPSLRRGLIKRMAAWLVAFGLIAACHYYWFVASRADANRLASAVMEYKNKTGTFPPSEESLGSDFQSTRHKWMLGYSLQNGQPFLVYAATFIVFDAYVFDFESKTWQYEPD